MGVAMQKCLESDAARMPFLGVIDGGKLPPDESVNVEFKNNLKALFGAIDRSTEMSHKAELIKFLYSSTVIPEFNQSGSELAELLFSGLDANYRMPKAEKKFIDRNSALFGRMMPQDSCYVSLGCGPYTPVLTKDVAIARAISAKSYVAVDINEDQARRGAALVSERLGGIVTSSMSADFTAKFDLKARVNNDPVLMTLWGCTLCQFPVKPIIGNEGHEVLLEQLLTNIGKAVGKSGIFIASVDANKDPLDAESEYTGSEMRKFMQHLWWRAKHVIGDRNFNPDAFNYKPRYDKLNDVIVHSYIVMDATTAKIDEVDYAIPQGTTIDVGFSARMSPEDIKPVCCRSGWEMVRLPFDYDSTIRAVALVGKKTPYELKRRVLELSRS